MNFINKLGQYIVIIIEKLIFGSFTEPILQKEDYNWLTTIEENYNIILDEYNAFACGNLKPIEQLSAEQQKVVKRKKWNVFFLKIYGKDLNKNQINFINTMKLIAHKDILTAFFSVLNPDTHITPHRGPYKGVIRYHIGLKIPKDCTKCAIKIDNKIYNWQEGKSLLFDDTFEHEAWNYTDEQCRWLLF